jgi:hypothetical protein
MRFRRSDIIGHFRTQLDTRRVDLPHVASLVKDPPPPVARDGLRSTTALRCCARKAQRASWKTFARRGKRASDFQFLIRRRCAPDRAKAQRAAAAAPAAIRLPPAALIDGRFATEETTDL